MQELRNLNVPDAPVVSSAMTQRPILMERGGRFFCVVRYYATAAGTVMGEEMWDVTDQLQDLVEGSVMEWISPHNRVN